LGLIGFLYLLELGEHALVDGLGLGDKHVGDSLPYDDCEEDTCIKRHDAQHDKGSKSYHEHVDDCEFDSEHQRLVDHNVFSEGLVGAKTRV
jgi:hypothetical protein